MLNLPEGARGEFTEIWCMLLSRQEEMRRGFVLLFLVSGLKTVKKDEQTTHML